MSVFSGDPFGIQAAKLEDFYKFTEQDQTKLTLTGKITIMKRYNTAAGPLDIEILGHSSVIMHWNGQVIHIDPYSEEADYSEQPKADLILVTHHHSDHFDPDAIAEIRKKDTVVISTEKVAHALEGVTVLHNGERTTWNGITIRATPAYNIVNMRAPGEPFHIPGEGNGYVMEIDPLRIYIAGDTELIPEMVRAGGYRHRLFAERCTLYDERFDVHRGSPGYPAQNTASLPLPQTAYRQDNAPKRTARHDDPGRVKAGKNGTCNKRAFTANQPLL